ncbi:hypothetical protein AMAG_10268 [Allomyces macrogynus ATCC 38327]|uniref:Late embryogenesis abundant protein LEA-2 subgroup domain-containing protein n=1 Tax=Allomyces macrogynus (strain ATCC 38327) TaxID=578462 RepID=A0A0L0SUI9_ALLM3|nr:hypothetical protein AMAG_10268 [Allomyces macrogynus ATCC 38327]|eukprot:KNE65989.1 hypothetical protein AMAG_10268 [Allomyces macrogynus ATCC 38327]
MQSNQYGYTDQSQPQRPFPRRPYGGGNGGLPVSSSDTNLAAASAPPWVASSQSSSAYSAPNNPYSAPYAGSVHSRHGSARSGDPYGRAAQYGYPLVGAPAAPAPPPPQPMMATSASAPRAGQIYQIIPEAELGRMQSAPPPAPTAAPASNSYAIVPTNANGGSAPRTGWSIPRPAATFHPVPSSDDLKGVDRRSSGCSRACGCCACGWKCGCCVCLLVLILIVGGLALFAFLYVKVPTVAFAGAQAPTTRAPLALDLGAASATVNWDFAFSVTNANSFGVGVATLAMQGFPSSTATSANDRIANGSVSDVWIAKNAATRVLFPVTFTWQLAQASQSTYFNGLLTACGATGGTGGGQMSVYYELAIGLSLLKPFGITFPYKSTQSFACPVNLSQLNGIQQLLQAVQNATGNAGASSSTTSKRSVEMAGVPWHWSAAAGAPVGGNG